jgi:hypothetical protein
MDGDGVIIITPSTLGCAAAGVPLGCTAAAAGCAAAAAGCAAAVVGPAAVATVGGAKRERYTHPSNSPALGAGEACA